MRPARHMASCKSAKCYELKRSLFARFAHLSLLTYKLQLYLYTAVRTVQPCPAARGRPTRPGGMARSPGLVWAGPPAPSRRPEHGRFSPPSGPRRTRTGVEHGPAEGVPHSRLTLSPAPNRHGADQIIAWVDSSSKDSAPRARAPPQQLAALAPCEAHRPRRKGRR